MPTEPTPPVGAPRPARLPRNVWVLGAASLLNDVASEAVFPLIPAYLKSIGGSLWHLGLIEGAADSVASLLKLLAGAWSDRLASRKGVVVGGYLVTALIRPLVALANNPWQVLGVRLADRVGKGVRTAPRDALLVDSTPSSLLGRAFGFHRSMDHLGAAIGPGLAFGFLWLFPNQLRWLFALTALPGLAVIAILGWGLREPRERRPTKTLVLPRWSKLPSVYRRYLLIVALFTLANSSDAFLLVRAQELGIGATWLPLVWMVFHLVKSAGNLLGGNWVDRFGPRPVLIAGWIAYAAVYLAWGVAQSAWHAWLLMVLYAGYFACAEPAEKALVAQLVADDQKGQAYGWFHFTVGLSTLPASLAFGLIYQQLGGSAAFFLGALVAATAALLVATAAKPRPDDMT